ncbi:cell division protein PerM [Agromyces sp. M3QZ16-3]|uniref:cell division protein PerM n=1 Tax=Agromyces sp. M3QZ16-3 TaxID=3447585 RepID=UPI003F69228A
MRRTTIALLAALEATVAVLVGLGLALVPLMLLWAVHFGLAAPVDVFFRAAADVWLLGHGVDLVVQLDPATAATVGVAGADAPFTIGIALLGFAGLTFLFGLRIGRRATATGTPIVGAVSAVLVTALLGTALAVLVAHPVAQPVLWQAAVLPGMVMGGGVLAGVAVAFGRSGWATDAATSAVRDRLDTLPFIAWAGIRSAIRVGVGSAVGVIGVAAAILGARIVIDHPTIIGLYQALGAGVDGGIAITLVELALLPNLVVWAASWMLGPGFAVGAGTVVSPSVTLIGPIPGLPILGALPADGAPLGVLWLALPVLLGFGGAVLVGRGKRERDREPWWATLAVGAGAGVVAGLVLGVLAWGSGGAAGPGHLVEVGPDALLVAGVTAASVGVGAIAGAFAARARSLDAVGGPAESGGRPWWRDGAGDGPGEATVDPSQDAGSGDRDAPDDVETVELEGLTRGSRRR